MRVVRKHGGSAMSACSWAAGSRIGCAVIPGEHQPRARGLRPENQHAAGQLCGESSAHHNPRLPGTLQLLKAAVWGRHNGCTNAQCLQAVPCSAGWLHDQLHNCPPPVSPHCLGGCSCSASQPAQIASVSALKPHLFCVASPQVHGLLLGLGEPGHATPHWGWRRRCERATFTCSCIECRYRRSMVHLALALVKSIINPPSCTSIWSSMHCLNGPMGHQLGVLLSQPGPLGQLLARVRAAGCFRLPPWRGGVRRRCWAPRRRRRRPSACCSCWASSTRRCCASACPRVGRGAH
jgi:hypothetical protein